MVNGLYFYYKFQGCYIRAYQHANKEGYSSICSDSDAGCALIPTYHNGALPANEASSVYCYCDQPSK